MLKVGDKVIIRKDLEEGIYGGLYCSIDMVRKGGKEDKIISIEEGCLYRLETDEIWLWDEEMLEVAKKPKQEVIVQMDCVESIGDITVYIDTEDILQMVFPYSIKIDEKFYKNKNVITCIRKEGDIKGVGISYCHPLDEFDYATGLCIAECRAIIDIENKKIRVAKKGRK